MKNFLNLNNNNSIFLGKKRRIFYRETINKIKKQTPNFELGGLDGIADDGFFSKSDITNWSYKLYTITQFINYTIPLYPKVDIRENKANNSWRN